MNYIFKIVKSGFITASIVSVLFLIGMLVFEKPIPAEAILSVGIFWIVAVVVNFQDIRRMSKQQQKNITLAFGISSISVLVLVAFSLYAKNLLQNQ